MRRLLGALLLAFFVLGAAAEEKIGFVPGGTIYVEPGQPFTLTVYATDVEGGNYPQFGAIAFDLLLDWDMEIMEFQDWEFNCTGWNGVLCYGWIPFGSPQPPPEEGQYIGMYTTFYPISGDGGALVDLHFKANSEGTTTLHWVYALDNETPIATTDLTVISAYP